MWAVKINRQKKSRDKKKSFVEMPVFLTWEIWVLPHQKHLS